MIFWPFLVLNPFGRFFSPLCSLCSQLYSLGIVSLFCSPCFHTAAISAPWSLVFQMGSWNVSRVNWCQVLRNGIECLSNRNSPPFHICHFSGISRLNFSFIACVRGILVAYLENFLTVFPGSLAKFMIPFLCVNISSASWSTANMSVSI